MHKISCKACTYQKLFGRVLRLGYASILISLSLQEIFKSEDDGVLSSNDFGKLDKLIEQTSQFSTFLTEQMKVRSLPSILKNS